MAFFRLNLSRYGMSARASNRKALPIFGGHAGGLKATDNSYCGFFANFMLIFRKGIPVCRLGFLLLNYYSDSHKAAFLFRLTVMPNATGCQMRRSLSCLVYRPNWNMSSYSGKGFGDGKNIRNAAVNKLGTIRH